ncbi:MAG: hypothetical protein ABIZ04_17020 [Opitutus sp.]
MMPTLQQIVTNPWVQFASIVFGLLGVAYAVVIEKRKTRKISVSKRSFNLVRKHRSAKASLSVKFQGRDVEDLTVTKISIWNSGTDPVRSSDFPEKDQLRIDSKTTILESEIIQTSHPSCDCGLGQLAAHEQILTFTYLNPNEGMVVEVIHSGEETRSLNVRGRFIGKGKIIDKNLTFSGVFGAKFSRKKRIQFALFSIVLGAAGVFLPPLTVLFGPISPSNRPTFVVVTYSFMLGAGLLYMYLGMSLLRMRAPKGLERYDEEFGAQPIHTPTNSMEKAMEGFDPK